MIYNFNGTLINVADIVSVQSTKGQRSDYPFVLTVALKNGQQFAVSYATEPSRRAEVNRLAQAYERSVPPPVTRYEVEQIISTYTNKVKNDLRAIKRMLKEGAENG